jgi:hypothetical protein
MQRGAELTLQITDWAIQVFGRFQGQSSEDDSCTLRNRRDNSANRGRRKATLLRQVDSISVGAPPCSANKVDGANVRCDADRHLNNRV